MTPSEPLAEHYLRVVKERLASQKQLGEGALAQLEPEHFAWAPDPESNSIAVIVKHLRGNMRSRWTDFLTSDGEKPDRMRDDEFVLDEASPETVMAWWEEGWGYVFAALEALQPGDLQKTVTIRGQAHSVLDAVERQLTHYAQHVGQIVYVAKMLKGGDWRTLSIARGASTAYRPSR